MDIRRIVFLGSPEAVLPVLQALPRDQVVAVVSQPARPVGRKAVLTDPPVAAYAKAQGMHCLQPEDARSPEFIAALQELRPDLCVTAAYGQILNKAFLAIPRRGTINVHPSLLPLYRGATPVQSALLNGENITGVSILFTVRKLDAGAIISQRSVHIAPDETADALLGRLFTLGSEMLTEVMAKLTDEAYAGTPQDEAKVTHCTKIQKEDGRIQWQDSAASICNRFRAFQPWPGVFTLLAGKRLVICACKPNLEQTRAPGSLDYDKSSKVLVVGTGEGVLCVERLKPEGGKDVDAAAFWNGLKERSQVRFEV